MTDDPQAHNRKDLRRFYTDLVSKHGWQHVRPLLGALNQLLALRQERGLFTFTSHELLMFTTHPEYPAWAEDDVVAVTPLRSGKVEVTYVRRRGLPSEQSVTVDYDALVPTVDASTRRLTAG